MNRVRFRFVSGRGLLSQAIKLGTYSDWSHVEALSDNGQMTYGAMLSGGVRFRRVTDPCYDTVSKVEIVSVAATSEQFHAFWRFLLDQRGKRYDKLAIASFVPLVRLCLRGQMRRSNWRLGKEWFCSTLMLAASERAGSLLRAPDGDAFVSFSPGIFRAMVEQRQVEVVRASGAEARSKNFASEFLRDRSSV